jgi:transposase
VEEVVMGSTAQYWRSVWLELEPHMSLHLAQAFSNKAPRGRKHDFKGAERLARRFMAKESIMSFLPGEEQSIWRNLTRMKLQLKRDRVRLHGQIECLLEEMRIKLSVVVTDLFGPAACAFCMLWRRMRPIQRTCSVRRRTAEVQRRTVIEALTGRSHPVHRQMLGLQLQRLGHMNEQIATLNTMIAQAMKPYQEAVIRLAEVPGFGIDSAQQMIAEVGASAAKFSSAAEFTPWVGTCRGKKRAPRRTTVAVAPKTTSTCVVYSTRSLMLQQEAREPISRRSSGVLCHDWAIYPPFGLLHIGSAGWSGRSFTRAFVTSSGAQATNQSFSSIGPYTWQNSFAGLAMTSTSLLRIQSRHECLISFSGDFRRSNKKHSHGIWHPDSARANR